MTFLPALIVSLSLVSQLPLATPGATTVAAEPDVAVVCPALLEPALAPWIEFRSSQGHRIVTLRAEQSPEAIREQLRGLARNHALRFVLLVGDADPALYTEPAVRARCVPANYVAAKINVKWGSETYLSSDNYYADLDGDDLPELAIGRLTADSPEELSLIVRKILAYEKTPDTDSGVAKSTSWLVWAGSANWQMRFSNRARARSSRADCRLYTNLR